MPRILIELLNLHSLVVTTGVSKASKSKDLIKPFDPEIKTKFGEGKLIPLNRKHLLSQIVKAHFITTFDKSDTAMTASNEE